MNPRQLGEEQTESKVMEVQGALDKVEELCRSDLYNKASK